MTDLEMELVKIDSLNPYHRNPRRGDVAKIAESLEASGQYKPIVVNRGTQTDYPNEILAGNHTWQAAKSLKWDAIQVVWVDVDAESAARIVLADNKIAELGTYDTESLADVIESIKDPATGTGYTDDDIADILAAANPEHMPNADPEQVPEIPKEAYTKPGQIWHLGKSILVVGSSTDGDLVQKAAALLPEPQCIWTDPPYGINYVGGTKDKLKISNDSSIAEAIEITKQAFANALTICRKGAPFYMAHPDNYRVEFQEGIESLGIQWRQTLIWVKSTITLGHCDYQNQFEPIAYGNLPESETDGSCIDEHFAYEEETEPIGYGFLPRGKLHGRLGRGGKRWYGDDSQSTAQFFPKPRANKDHPTMKPVELIQSMLANSCRRGGVVYDPFGGSGSTLIAATGLGMRCLTVELDTKYADVICRRYQQYTGNLPQLDGGEVHDFTIES